MKAWSLFSVAKKKLIEDGAFWGFTLGPCKMRALHNGKTVLFTTPAKAENFLLAS